MNEFKLLQPIDRLAIALIIILALVMGLLVWSGSGCDAGCLFHTGAKVSNFSWQNKTIGGEDRAFILTFNRPTDRQSVAENLKIAPALPGKISWSGLRLAYTLDHPVPYGESYNLSLQGARERFPKQTQPGAEIKPFQAQFRSRDRALAYIGTEGVEQGRLVLYNWTRQQKTILTPPNLNVFEFKPYPQGDRLLFSAADTQTGVQGIQQLQLYRVTSQFNPQEDTVPQIELVLDNHKYQNNKFEISQDGKTIVIQRLERANINNYGLWKIRQRDSPQLITDAQVGDFLITPDSQAVAVAQGEGIAILPLEANAKPIDFLPKFGQVLDFTVDGTGAAMIDYNTDNPQRSYTRSLYYVNNQGIKQELLNTEGSIQNCQFAPDAKHLYCWLTELEQGAEYKEKPYLSKINLQTGKMQTLVTIPKYQESKISIAPDGLGVLFTRSLDTNASLVQKNSIWLSIPPEDSANQASVEQLPFMGLHPQWLP